MESDSDLTHMRAGVRGLWQDKPPLPISNYAEILVTLVPILTSLHQIKKQSFIALLFFPQIWHTIPGTYQLRCPPVDGKIPCCNSNHQQQNLDQLAPSMGILLLSKSYTFQL